jgi:outer membrane protein assembly factor BamA
MTVFKCKINFHSYCYIPFFLCVPFLLSAQDSTKQKKTSHFLAFPVIANSIETGFSFGAAATSTYRINKADTLGRTSNMQAVAIYSLKKQLVAAINNTIYFSHENYILTNQFSYSSFPDKFWGIGQNTPEAAVEPYTFNQVFVYGHLQKKVAPHFFIVALYSYQNVFKVTYQPGGLFDQQQVTGRYPYHISGLGVSFTYDDRNNAFAPNKGTFLQFYANHFDKVTGSSFNFNQFVVDTRKYFRIYKEQVLALQVYGIFNTGNEVPLRSLGALGGSSIMRGYYEGRYRDRDMAEVQSEYRVPIWRLISGVVFASMGNVGHAPNDFSFDYLKYSYGGGLRIALNKKEKLNLRLDYGFAKNSNGFYLQVGEAF